MQTSAQLPRGQIITLRIIGAIGFALFSFFFAMTIHTPESVERFAADFIEQKARERTNAAIDDFRPKKTDSLISGAANKLYDKNEEKILEAKAKLKAKLHEVQAKIIAEARNLDCECRNKYVEFFREGFEFEIQMLQKANDRIVEFVQYKYLEVANALKKDIRIFTASNALAFLVILLLSFLKPRSITHLFAPGILLAIATVASSYGYIFEQNWLLTIIYSDYMGLAYAGYLGVVFLFLCDILLNGARVTTEIINAVFNALGSAFSVGPC